MSLPDKLSHNDYLTATIALREQIESGFIILAERLKKIRDERLWETGEYDNFEAFVREMRISPSTASKLIGVYEKFVLIGGIPIEDVAKVGWTNISLFLPKIKTKEDAQEIWDKTHLLDRTDAQRTWQEMKLGVDMQTCNHDNSYFLRVCRSCGLKMEHHEKEEN